MAPTMGIVRDMENAHFPTRTDGANKATSTSKKVDRKLENEQVRSYWDEWNTHKYTAVIAQSHSVRRTSM